MEINGLVFDAIELYGENFKQLFSDYQLSMHHAHFGFGA
jgi:hypothetical protein